MKSNLIIIFLLLTIIACTNNEHSVDKDNAIRDFNLAIRNKNQKRALLLTDSLERSGHISTACADFMRGKAYDFTYQKRLGELYYRKSYDVLKAKPAQEWDTYAEVGYRLSAVLSMRSDIEGSLAVATEMLKVAEQNKDFPAEYKWSLLMQIAYCYADLNQDTESAKAYDRAYKVACDTYGGEGCGKFNMMVIESNIFFHLCGQKNYAEANSWLERFQKELSVYEQHGDSLLIEEYRGHRSLMQAILLQATGHAREAAAVYDAIPRSRFVNSFVVSEALEYLMAAGRYEEAVKCCELLDGPFSDNDDARMDFENISYRLTPRFMANYKAGHADVALKLGADICEAIDSALVWQKKNDAAELAVVYQTHEKEIALEKSKLETRIHRVLLISAMLIIVLISYLLYRSYKYNKVLMAKNRKLYEEIEQHEQEQQQVIEKLEATPEASLNANQQLYRQICEIMKNPDIFTEPETNQDTIAAIVGTNRTYVYDAIRECTNLTPADFINGYRLRHAATLLATTDHSVALIAELCGLSRRTFYRLFNDTYSMSPSDYRKVACNT